MLRKAFFRLFRENQFAVRCHVELTATPDDDVSVDAQRVIDRGRQTGGLRKVVSNFAVADRQLHDAVSLQQRWLTGNGRPKD